ncbi:hypothetical protein [Gillisia sp. JM1]|uniref:hypothetical protein n=1 Tax=Gillisia sp. JM1 TaxID=1283286 RepID=UPI000558DCCD|nr:hypothetical protein [Gillisia sp. JM1]
MMIKKLFLIIILGISNISLAQNSNFIIQVNNEIITDGIIGLKLIYNVDNKKESSTDLKYVPGNLILNKKLWSKINSDSTNEIILSFNYQTFKKNKNEITNFQLSLSKNDFKRDYVIIDIYDFRNRKYKKWYQNYTDKNYLVNKVFPGSGIYPRYVD